MSRLRAVVHRGPGDVGVEDVADPGVPAEGEVLLRPLLVGICGTDRGIAAGRYAARPGVVLGHEAVAEVEAVGPGGAFRPGDRVVLNPTGWCGRCAQCSRGRTNLCREKSDREVGIVRHGALAERLRVAEQLVHRVGDAPLERVVMTEPLACVLAAADRAALSSSDDVVVMGGGPIGLLWVLVAADRGARVRIVERDRYRSAFAASLVEVLAELPAAGEGDAPSLVVDTTGRGEVLEAAVEVVAGGGRVVLMGCDASARASVAPFALTARCVSLVGSADYDAAQFPVALELAGRLDLERLVSHRFPLARFDEALACLGLDDEDAGYRAMKVLVEPQP